MSRKRRTTAQPRGCLREGPRSGMLGPTAMKPSTALPVAAPIVALAIALAAAPAAASSVPRVDFAGGEIFVAGGTLWPVRGALDFSVDWARDEREAWGVSLMA